MLSRYFLDIQIAQKKKPTESVCGDTVLIRPVGKEDGYVIVVADGLGSGLKASILSTMTASMAAALSITESDAGQLAELIANTLPVCSTRQISYSTFTIVSIDRKGHTTTLEFDNPPFLLMRRGGFVEVGRRPIVFNHPNLGEKQVLWAEFDLENDDRLFIATDGITQSGIEGKFSPGGWGIDGAKRFLTSLINKNPDADAATLALQLTNEAVMNDSFLPKDDITCVCAHMREPRRLLVLTGPPFYEERDSYIAQRIKEHNGKKAICGGTTAQIISRELGLPLRVDVSSMQKDVPPGGLMEGIDLITEGIITLGHAYKRLSSLGLSERHRLKDSKNLVDKLCHLLLDSDNIEFLVGTRVNEAHQDPSLPVELDIRRNIVKQIKAVLTERFYKKVVINYV